MPPCQLQALRLDHLQHFAVILCFPAKGWSVIIVNKACCKEQTWQEVLRRKSQGHPELPKALDDNPVL
jgi:hypothetical protein